MAADVTTTAVPTRATPDSDSGTPPRPNPNKPMGFLAYANSALKRHYPTAPAAVGGLPEFIPARLPPAVSYKECMRNHAATIGGHAVDGCCEFIPSPAFDPADPTSLRCGACGCHRNFHRRDPDDPAPLQLHRHIKNPAAPFHPAAPASESPSSPPTPVTFSSAPHALMAIRKSGGPATAPAENGGGRKRHRTKFSQEQKEKMYEFAEKLGWKMQKVEKGLVEDFCNEVGVGREVLKVWMHNNKNTIGNGNGTGEKGILNNGGNATLAAPNINISNSNGGHHFELVHLVANRTSSSSDD